MTTEATPGNVPLSDQLGPLPEPYTRQWINAPFTERLLFTEDQMRAYGKSARMAGVHSVQEQTAVIVRAALELLESIEGETPFTAEKMRAFKRVFGA
jgi:hypothetical protein